MSAKLKEINKWLKEVYGEKPVPEYTRNEANIETLSNLMQSTKEAFTDLETVKGFNMAMESRYGTYVKEKMDTLQTLGFPIHIDSEGIRFIESVGDQHGLVLGLDTQSHLDSEDMKCIEAVTDLCFDMNLESVNSTSIMAGISLLEDENYMLCESLEKEKLHTEKLLKLSQNASRNLEQLHGILEKAEHTKSLQQHEEEAARLNAGFYSEKIKKYKSDIQHYEAGLNAVGFKEDISHSFLIERMKELQDLQKECKNSKDLLESFVLSPDLSLARFEVEKAKEKLHSCISQVTQNYERSSE